MKKLLIIILISILIISCTQIKIGSINEEIGHPPHWPSDLTIQYIGNNLELNWSDNIESDFKEYKIYRSIDKHTFPYTDIESHKLLSTTSESYFLDTNVIYTNNNYHYEYRIYAVDIEGLRSDYSYASKYF